MHRVVEVHLEDFCTKFGIAETPDRAFEAFTSYVILRKFSHDHVNPIELIYDGDDPGIDSILIFVDDSYVSSEDEISDLFRSRVRDRDVTICFTQSKTSESWDKGGINKFESAINDFLATSSAYPQSDYIAYKKSLFNKLIENVGRIRNGRPRFEAYYATTAAAIKPQEREISAALAALKESVQRAGLFSSVDVFSAHRDTIVNLWNAADGPIETSLKTIGLAAFPRSSGIEESYVATVSASDFVHRIVMDSNGNIRQRIFDENVRDFVGMDNDINREMSDTASNVDKQRRFGILNNGVTIISPDVRVQGNELFLRDFQIVNGCQTSNVLFENIERINPDATLMLKVVETSDPVLIDEIVRSTNRQTKVQDEQFLATLDCAKAIEKYFNARGEDEEHRLYFERRSNQFTTEDVPEIRVFSIKEIARCVGAMFLDKPDLASRYPNKLTDEQHKLVFNRENMEDIYYTAAYSLYRIKLLIGNRRIDPGYSKLRWHLLMAIRQYLSAGKSIQLSSPKIRDLCKKIDQFMSKSDDETVGTIRRIAEHVVDIREITRDRLRSPTLVQEVTKKMIAFPRR